MARAFTQSNKDRIRANLIQKGREYFIRYGLKKTSVEELAKAVGIAKGSFYKFFDSKEALFFAIHEESESALRTNFLQKLEADGEPADKLRLFLEGSFRMIEQDPLLRIFFNIGEFEDLSGLMTSEQFKEHYQENIVFLEGLLRQWQESGIIRPLDVKTASHMLASVFHVVLQRETLGEEMYTRVTDMLVECLVCYLSGTK